MGQVSRREEYCQFGSEHGAGFLDLKLHTYFQTDLKESSKICPL